MEVGQLPPTPPTRNSSSSVLSQNRALSPLQRRSRISRLTTHSWGNTANSPEVGRGDGASIQQTQTDTSFPPPPSPRRVPLHTTNPDDALEDEYMNIDADVSGTAMGYQNAHGKLKKDPRVVKKKKGYVGSLVKGLKKFSGTVLGYPAGSSRRRYPGSPLEDTSTGNTLPRYVSNPNSPVVASERPRRPLPSPPGGRPALSDIEGAVPSALVPGMPPSRPTPALRVTPPLPVSQRTSHHSTHPSIHHAESGASDAAITMPIPAPAQPNAPPGPSRRSTSHQSHFERTSHATRIELHDDQGTIGRSPSGPSSYRPPISSPPLPEPAQISSRDRSHRTSVLVRPLPTQDYRRMSKTITHNTASTMSYEPSFSTELSPVHGFFSTLWHMPWIATDRITVDYVPGMSRGAWEWKRVASKRAGHEDKTRMEYKPVAKPIKSWYTGIPPVSRDSMPGWAKTGDAEREALDLLSSGTSATRSSMATSNGGSPTPVARRSRFSPHRDSRTLFYPPNQYSFLDTHLTSTPRRKVKVEHRTRKERSANRQPERRHHGRRHRHAESKSHQVPPPVPPMPPAATYMHGYAPYQPSAPIYFVQSPTIPPHQNIDGQSPMSGDIPQGQPHPLLSPLFMVHGVPSVVPFQGDPSLAGSTGTASPPGVAGRGAGTTGTFPGGFLFGGMSPASPRAG